ncbi:MAG: hypothetical protein II670_08840, partial [Alphaproteobacteria bacterium]|nr:hypothetical protein [Alphaproteobacteria bacterium]
MAKSIKELFGIEFDTNGFVASAKSVVTEPIVRNIKQRDADIAKCSKEILERFPTVSPPRTSDLLQIKKDFDQYKTDSILSFDLFSDKDIRLMCYFANQVANSKEDYRILIDLIQKRWRQSFLNGLIFCLLTNWSQFESNIITAEFKSFIINQLANYDGKRQHLCIMKSNIQFLKDGGSLALGQFILSNQHIILDAPSILGLKKRDFGYSYFSKVIQYYYKSTSGINPSELEEVLTLHANNNTNKIVISDKIVKADNLQNGLQAALAIKRIALKLIGDPFIRANWNTFGIDQNYASQISLAHSILKRWLIKSYITIAFDKLIVDQERKVFWLKCADRFNIDDIKIVGSYQHKSIISSNLELKEALINCFHLQSSNSDTCAVAIQIKDYYFFEFSMKGNACYVYNNDRKMKMIEHGIRKVDELKETGLPMLIESG